MINFSLQDGTLDYLHSSVHSMPSIDQPGNGSCCISAIEKVTWDARFLSKVNAAVLSVDLPMISKLDSTKLRVIILLCSYAFGSGDQSNDAFKRTLNIIKDL